MATISSTGVGSGLDVNSIVSKLVAIEKQPLQTLQAKATTFQTQLSLYGTIKSQLSALGDAATKLSTASGWSSLKASVSNPAVATVTAGDGASATSFGLEVSQLARAQTAASRNIATGSTLGVAGETGSLTIKLGSWASGSFVPGSSSVTVSGINGDDSLATIASKINGANAGVTATVMRSGTQERLVFRSSNTGAEAGFEITSDGGFAGLNSLSFNNLANPAESALGMQLGQTGLNAQAKINGVSVESASNTLSDAVPGLAIKLTQTTASPVDVTVSQDQEAVQKNIQTFVDAYNALAKTLADATKFVQGGKSGSLQGDSTTIGIQNLLRRTVSSTSSGSTFDTLSSVGLEQQKDGSLKINATKLDKAMGDMGNLQKLFAADNGNSSTNGFGLKFKEMARSMLAFDGSISAKSEAIQSSITRNNKDQDRVTERASRLETQLRRQYSALDTQMAQLNSLGSYVNAQLAQWNKSSS